MSFPVVEPSLIDSSILAYSAAGNRGSTIKNQVLTNLHERLDDGRPDLLWPPVVLRQIIYDFGLKSLEGQSYIKMGAGCSEVICLWRYE